MTRQNYPNVLIIVTDQQRHDLLSCAGASPVRTPNIDRLAARGVRFTNAYCAYPVCVASRMAMLTGLYAHTTGAIDNEDHLDWRYRTLAHHFAARGYLTGLIGKMHFGDAHKHGFEYYLSINDYLMYLGPKAQLYADEIASNPHAKEVFLKTVFDTGAGFPDVYDLWDGKGSPWAGHVAQRDFTTMASLLEEEDQLDMFVARESVKFLRRHGDQPFCLVCGFMKPHTPLFAPGAYVEKYPADRMEWDIPEDLTPYPPHIRDRIRHTAGISQALRQANMSGYLAGLDFADHCIGLVLDAAEKAGLLDNTVIVFTSDHGDMLGHHGLQGKFCLYDYSVRAPLIVSYPRALPAGAVCKALVEQIGLYPTLAELTGTGPVDRPALVDWDKAPEQIEARGFGELLRHPEAAGPEAIFSEYALRSAAPQYMVREGRYKLVHHDGGEHQLYDLQEDPGEYRNLYDEPSLAHVQAALRDRLRKWYKPESNPFRREIRDEERIRT